MLTSQGEEENFRMDLKKQLASALGAGILVFSGSTVTLAAEPPTAPMVQQVGQATFGNLIAALNNIAVEIDQLNALNNLNVEDVQVVNVRNLLNGNNVNALNNALNRNNVEILNLRNVLNNNEIVKDVLNDANIDIGQVVAIDVLSGGDVIVFYQPR